MKWKYLIGKVCLGNDVNIKENLVKKLMQLHQCEKFQNPKNKSLRQKILIVKLYNFKTPEFYAKNKSFIVEEGENN